MDHSGEQHESSTNADSIKKQSKYSDDISMFMTYQNWCWMNYSASLYQYATLLKSYHTHLIGQSLQQVNSWPQPQVNLQQQQQQPPDHRRTTVKLASIQKRIAAEIIDFVILALVKVLVIYNYYGEEYMEKFSFVLIIDDKTSLDDLQWMLFQALFFRIVVVAYEAYMLSGTLPFSNGYTLGKNIMGITSVYCTDIEEVNPVDNTVRITPQPLGVGRSCLRSLMKNMTISLLFPMILPMLTFSNNRLIYDVAVGSLVIEK